jgi:D-aminopeptidase
VPISSFAKEDTHRMRARELGIEVGVMEIGGWNAITDVEGVRVGHRTIIRGDSIRTGVTAILPHEGNLFRNRVPGAIYVGNGFGKLVGFTQVEELGAIETPIVLTNTLSVGTAMTALVKYVLSQPGNEDVCSVNAVVGETNDGYLNDIRGLHITEEDVLDAIGDARSGPVGEGSVGAGTGTTAFGFKGGIGTASREVPTQEDGYYTVGVLIQSNYGGMLDINGAPVGRELNQSNGSKGSGGDGEGSCMIVVATDAPLCSRNLKRLAKRALHGLARTGSCMSNRSGEYVIAFSTAYRIPHITEPLSMPGWVPDDATTPLFCAVVEATQEAVYNSMLAASTVQGQQGRIVRSIPVDQVVRICEKYNVLHLRKSPS